MSDDEWDNLLEGIDKYIDAFKERIKQLKEMQEEAVFDKAAPDAPPIVKNAWMNAAKETGYLEGGKMNYISQLLVRQVINRENGAEDYQNVFGNSVASAREQGRL